MKIQRPHEHQGINELANSTHLRLVYFLENNDPEKLSPDHSEEKHELLQLIKNRHSYSCRAKTYKIDFAANPKSDFEDIINWLALGKNGDSKDLAARFLHLAEKLGLGHLNGEVLTFNQATITEVTNESYISKMPLSSSVSVLRARGSTAAARGHSIDHIDHNGSGYNGRRSSH